MTALHDTADDRVIGTPKREPPRSLRLVIVGMLGLSMGLPVAFTLVGLALLSTRLAVLVSLGGVLIPVGVTLMYAARLLYRVPLRGWAASAYAAGGIIALFSTIAMLPMVMLFVERVIPALGIGVVAPATAPAPINRSTIMPYMFALIISILGLFLLINLVGAYYKLYAAMGNILRSHDSDRFSTSS